MGRRKLSRREKLEVVGVSLPPDVVARLLNVRQQWALTTDSAAVRELFLLGLSIYESLEANGVELPFLDLTKAYRRPSQTAHDPIAPTDKEPTPEDFGLKRVGVEVQLPGAEPPHIGPAHPHAVEVANATSPGRQKAVNTGGNGSGSP